MRLRRSRRRGIAAVEFLFAAPAFFVLVFFVVEVALVWNDRHMMRLAAYKAARSVVKTRASQHVTGSLCWIAPATGGAVDSQSKEAQVAARRAAAKIMAMVTPSVTQLLTMFHLGRTSAGQPTGSIFDGNIAEDTANVFGTVTATADTNPYVHAVVRMMKGLPAAWLFTDLRCQDVVYPASANTRESRGVEITLVYHRPAKMPFVGNLMWALHKIQELARSLNQDDDGTQGLLRINPLHYGLEVDLNSNSPQMLAVRERLRNMITEKANELGQRIAEAEQGVGIEFPSTSSVTGANLPQVFGAAAGAGFDLAMDKLETWRAGATVNWVADQALNLFLQAPDELKTIPVTVSVRIPNYNQAYANSGSPWDGKAVLVGAFTDQSKIAKLARELGKMIDVATGSEPPAVRGLPYVAE